MTPPLVDKRIVQYHIGAGMFWFSVALVAGFLYSLQLIQSWPLPKIELLSPGRIRMVAGK